MHTDPEQLHRFEDVRAFLFSLRNTGMKYGIERMSRLVEAIGHPERAYPIIHVAGTNGKGSTCATIESIYRHAGYTTGLYTSPHLVRLNERVQVDREPIPDAKVVEMTRNLISVGNALEAEETGLFPSFFEFMTAMAFIYFQEKAVDVGIIEVGLGGRLDATNVVNPAITAITSIALDHTQILGDTLEKIACEKAGILKDGVPVVLGRIQEGPRKSIEQIAGDRACPVARPADIDDDALPHSALPGNYQRINAAVAVECVKHLQPVLPVSESSILSGLDSINWSGRWERLVLENGQEMILDSSHNSEGTMGLVENLESLRKEYAAGSRFPIIAGTLGRDRAEALLHTIAPFAAQLIWIRPNQPRASEWEAVSAFWPSEIPAEERGIQELFPKKHAVALAKTKVPIIATGSIYLIGEIHTQLQGLTDGGDTDLQDDLRK
ncbi:MAG: folylpolyglutamate synthase/dihydrofolate synthase family protein [Verrucomicrobiota bacterium]